MDDHEVILITSSTGNTGRELVQLLVSSRYLTVRCGTRDPKSDAALLLKDYCADPHRVELVEFDPLGKPDTVTEAMKGVIKLYLLPPLDPPNMVKWHDVVVGAAVASKTVRYIIKHSVIGAKVPAADEEVGIIQKLHGQGEEIVRKSNIPYTIIRPNMFMQHLTQYPVVFTKGDDSFYLPTGDAKMALVDCRDVAAMAFALLDMKDAEEEDHFGATYDLYGAVNITASQIAAILSRVAGRPIKHVDGEEELVNNCKKLNASDAIKNAYREAKRGRFELTTDDNAFLDVVGRYQNTFAKFASDHSDHYKK
jgi:uncharacterized protein YbjT (DUF2867 family)